MTPLGSSSAGRPKLQHWLQLLLLTAIAVLLLLAWPGATLAQPSPGVQPPARAAETVRATRPAPSPAAKQKTAPAEVSAEELNRRFNEGLQARLQEEARPEDEARRPQASRGFFGRMFNGSAAAPAEAEPVRSVAPPERETQSQRGFFARMFNVPAAPGAEPEPARAAPPIHQSPIHQAQVQPPAAAPEPVVPAPQPAPAPTVLSPGRDQVAQAPPQQQPVPPPPVPVQPTPPTLITPPPPPGPVPTPTPVQDAQPRQFGRSAVVPTEQPSLAIDAGKGTIVRLRSPASTIFVANPDIADVQVKTGGTIYVFGKRPGETVLYAVDDQDRVLLNTVVIVGHPVGRVISNVAGMQGASGIQATTVGGAVVLQGRADNPGAIEQARRMAVGVTGDPTKVINNVALEGPNQVLLRVRIVEAQREALKRLGFNWESVFRVTNSLTAGLATPTDILFNADGSFNRIANAGALFGRYQNNGTDIFGLIDLLATENMLTILAEPNLTAMSGETASFLAGGEFPIIVPQQNGLATVTFKQFGVSLAFTPTIHANGRISLRAKPEVSQLSTQGAVNFQGFTIPALTTRRVDTTVELASGQSFAIAGLIQNNSVQNINKLPGLGDIPVLGVLFKSDSFQRNQSELVIIVTPYLVRATNRPLATPTDGFVPPTDADRWLFGRTHRAQGAARPSAPPSTSRARVGGFMLE